ncbi:MAG: acyl-CoA dehydrogenase, partial [Streptosporangiales bacterium]|nr:acyl-CoA dehydrogenase [Streptosporangiales bacterium]
VLPDGSRNSYRIDRLKDKLGTRSMASGEVTLHDTYAQPIGDLTRGVQQMLEMVNHSRISNVMRSSALMRRAVNESVAHTRQRVVSGRRLFDQPLMRRTLLAMILEAEASLGLLLEASAQLAAGDAGDERAHTVARVMTPMAKYTVCKRGRWVTGEAMEVRGGNGYIEDWINPRLLRDSHLGSIWEGSSNVVALDVLRCMHKSEAHRALHAAYRDRGGDAGLAAHWDGLRDQGEEILTLDRDDQELHIGDYTEALCRAVQAALLLDQARYETGAGGGARKQLVADAFLQTHLRPGTVPQEAVRDLELVAFG